MFSFFEFGKQRVYESCDSINHYYMNKKIYVVMEYCSLEYCSRNLNFLNKIIEEPEEEPEKLTPMFTNVLQKEEYVVEE